MTTLHIQLLGDFRLVYGDETVTNIHQTRLQSLFAYLLLHPTPHPRQQLAFLFWPDTSEAQARTNLRRELYHLRHGLPAAEQFLQIDAKSVAWRPDVDFTLDVADFEQSVRQSNRAEEAGDLSLTRAHLERAVGLYRGKLLPDCYDDWVLPQRERLAQRLTRTLERLILLLEDQREYTEAIRYAQALLRHDPLSETTYRRLMRLHARNGDRAGALRVFHTCASILQRELDVEPNQETQDAYARVLNMAVPRVVRPRATTPSRAVSSLVGRQPEWQALRAIWRQAVGGEAHFVLIAGEAGIGKTRLAEELYNAVSQQGVTAARTRSYAAEGALAYAPVIEWLRTEALRASLGTLDAVWRTEVARLLPELLVARPDLASPAPLSERWQRQRLFEALARAVLADSQPRLLFIDDLQWCDRETLEWLRYLLRFDPAAPLLIVGGMRVEEVDADHPLTDLVLALRSSEQLTELELAALDADQTAALAAQVASHDLDPAAAAQLYRETEGNPLFVIETMRADSWRLETGDQRLETRDRRPETGDRGESTSLQSPVPNSLSLPPKVHAVIQSRLAQLSTHARELAALAATIGRSFTLDVLRHASDSDEDALVRGLDELWQRRIVREQGVNAYDFSHDRIRETAYSAISPVRRRMLHRRVAEALESVHAADLDDVSGEIAAHFERAGSPERAIPYYQRAGEAAQSLYANQEAFILFRKGLALLATRPESSARDQHELVLQRALGISLSAVRGPAHEDVEEVYLRAHTLSRKLGQVPDIAILRGLGSVFAVRGKLRRAQELARELMELVQVTQKSDHLIEAHYELGMIYGWMGDYIAAQHHLQQIIALHDPERHRDHAARYGQNPDVTSRIRLALALWFLGYPDRAERYLQEGLTLAQELAHPISWVYALLWYAKLHEHVGNPAITLTYAEKTIAVATEYSLPLWSTQGVTHRGWALSELGQPEEGAAQIQAGMTAHEQTGARAPRPWHLALLATAYGKLGKFKEALAALDEALALAETNGILDCQAERWRLKGDLLLQSADPSPGSTLQRKAEDCFQRAIEIAQAQQARSLELRAALALSRLWQSRGQQAEARQMLAEIYNWFSEGFDTPDLRAAKALLDELA